MSIRSGLGGQNGEPADARRKSLRVSASAKGKGD